MGRASIFGTNENEPRLDRRLHTMALHGHGVELWGYFWSYPFRSDAHEVFDANYASRKTATRIPSAWKFVWDSTDEAGFKIAV